MNNFHQDILALIFEDLGAGALARAEDRLNCMLVCRCFNQGHSQHTSSHQVSSVSHLTALLKLGMYCCCSVSFSECMQGLERRVAVPELLPCPKSEDWLSTRHPANGAASHSTCRSTQASRTSNRRTPAIISLFYAGLLCARRLCCYAGLHAARIIISPLSAMYPSSRRRGLHPFTVWPYNCRYSCELDRLTSQMSGDLCAALESLSCKELRNLRLIDVRHSIHMLELLVNALQPRSHDDTSYLVHVFACDHLW